MPRLWSRAVPIERLPAKLNKPIAGRIFQDGVEEEYAQ